MREFKIIKKIFIIISIIAFIVFFVHAFYMDKIAKKNFLNEKYEGLITEIQFIEGMSDFPRYKINNQWIYFGMPGNKIAFKVEIGDSIVKKQGQTEIEVYRRNVAGEWVRQVFD